jgi:APA family basic amino acid/polyamine antiporter
MSRTDQLTGSIGVTEATALLVGNVIGVSIFVLPGPLAGQAGPAVAIGILLAAVPLAFGILTTLQLGSAIPVAGGNYVYGSRLVHPYAGFLIPWLVVPGVWAGLLFIGVGFAEYVGVFTDIPELALIYVILVPFLGLNIVGIRPVARVQLTLVVLLLASMVLFIVPGAVAIDPGNYTPFLPNGVGPFALAVVSLYFPLRGFSLIVDLGEELDDPVRTIPRVLLYSALIALTLFVLLVVVLVGVMDWQELGAADAAVVAASRTFLPAALVPVVAAGAVIGALTSISTTYTGFSRALMRAARDDVFPSVIARIDPRFGTPSIALLVLGIPPLLLAPVAPSPVVLSVWLALSVLSGATVNAVALWKLPQRFPRRYETAGFQLPPRALKAVAVLTALTSLVLIVVTTLRLPWMMGLFLGWAAVGYGYYRLRARSLADDGVDMPERMRTLADHE